MLKLFKNVSFSGVTFAQFFAAINDNAMRQAFLLIAVESAAQELQASASALFALPFIIFSPIAGQIADQYSKKAVIIATKAFEIGIVILAAIALWKDSLPILLIAILLMATQSTFFSPAKYGILPEILKQNNLSRGNGLIQMTTYVAILLGSAAAGILLQIFPVEWTGMALVTMGIIGFVPALLIEPLQAADTDSTLDWNSFRSVATNLSWVRHDRALLMSMLGFSFFFFLGTLLTLNLNVYGLKVMNLGEAATSLLMVFLAVGLGIGSLLAGRWSGDSVEIGLVPLGTVGMSLCLIVFTKSFESVLFAYFWLVLAGIFGGLFLIPLQTLLQECPPEDKVGDVLGTTNIITFVGVLVASATYVILIGWFNMSPQILMLSSGIATLMAGIGFVLALPRSFIRFVVWLLTHIFYSVEVRNPENIPRDGPALLVANHVSLVDGFLINAAFSRLVRFIGFGPFFEIPVLGWFFRLMKMIPVYPGDDEQIKEALDEARQALNNGEAVCIFPEGTVTRTGMMSPVREGVERLAENTEAPVVPIRLDEVWGSIFSYSNGQFFWKLPSKLPYPVTVTFGEPVEPPTTDRVRYSLQKLGADAADHRAEEINSIPEELIRKAHRNPFQFALAGQGNQDTHTYHSLLKDVLAISALIKSELPSRDRIGVALPPSSQSSLLNIALAFNGITSVNVPYGDGWPSLEYFTSRCKVDTLITNNQIRSSYDTVSGIENVVDMEALFEKVSESKGPLQSLQSWSPASLLLPDKARDPDATVTITFTRGSTGKPKPVELSHSNVLSNLQSLQQIYALETTDTMLSGLPLSHSFGYTGGLWFPLITGTGVVMQSDPYDVQLTEKLVQAYEPSLMVGLPSYFETYLETFDADGFSSVDYALTGGNQLGEKLDREFSEKFGLPLLEGYGCAETSPVISMNVPDVKFDGETFQQGHKPGTVGRPLPGVAVKIVDPDTFEQKNDGEDGLILVSGANVMKGYYDDPELTGEVLEDDWFITGDYGYIDEEGFLTIKGRL